MGDRQGAPTCLLRARMRQRSLEWAAAQALGRGIHSLAIVCHPGLLPRHQVRQVPGLHLQPVWQGQLGAPLSLAPHRDDVDDASRTR